MSERRTSAIKTIWDTTLNTYDRIHEGWATYNPDIYSVNDAKKSLNQLKNRQYLLDSNEINPELESDQSRIWSLPQEILTEIKRIVADSSHVNLLPQIMGTYEMSEREMSINDFCAADPYLAYMVATGGLEGFILPLLRSLYFAGRSSWWRHESIHVRHHHQMAYFLEKTDPKQEWSWDFYTDKKRMYDAMHTIHESGIEELVTRWQTLKESNGLREKVVSTLSLLLYLEYTPFTGTRNLFIDGKEKTLDLLEDGKYRIPAKFATLAGIIWGPGFINNQIHIVEGLGESVDQILPITAQQVSDLVNRIHAYITVAAFGSLFSTKEKGAYEKKNREGEALPTSGSKFPYVYNPVTSFTRSLRLLSYLNNTWDFIPNYRMIKSPTSIDLVKREIEDMISKNSDLNADNFTMKVINDALKPYEGQGRSTFPQEAHIKGMFLPAMNLMLSELFNTSIKY